MRWSVRGDQGGVSDVVGTMLLVAISIVLFSGLSIVVWDEMQTSPLPANTDLRLDVEGDWATVTHVWGESLPVLETRFLMTVDGVYFDHRLDQDPLAGNLTHKPDGSAEAWDVGETLWLTCPLGESCAFPNQTLDRLTGVDARANAVVFSNQPGVTPGLILSPLPDLVVSAEPVEDLSPYGAMYSECTYRFKAIVANTGLQRTPPSTTIVTTLYLDGSAIHSHSRNAPLQVGDSYIVEVDVPVSGAGIHVFKATVDEPDNVEEIAGDPPGENSNERSFTLVAGLADPGFAYEDVNDDDFANPCLTGENADQHDEIMDGTHTTSAGVGIVIPPSVGPVTATGAINYNAGGSLRLATDLSVSGANGVTLTAGGAVRFTGGPGQTVTSAGTVDVDAAGDVVAPGLVVRAEGFQILIDSTGGAFLADEFNVPPGTVSDAARLEVRVTGHISMQRSDVNVQNAIILDAQDVTSPDSLSLLLQDARLTADPGTILGGGVRLNGDGNVQLENLFVRTAQDVISIDVASNTNTVYLAGAHLETLTGDPNRAFLTPICPNRPDPPAYGVTVC